MNPARTLPSPSPSPSPPPLAAAIAAACAAVAPSWPLDRQIAVNPYWGFIDRPFVEAASTLRRLIGARFALPAAEYLAAWRRGTITAAALERAMAEHGVAATAEQAVAALQAGGDPAAGLPLPSDVLDRHAAHAGPRWRETITQQVSQYCASYFDRHQADWHRVRAGGLYAGWRDGLRVDHALEPLMHAPQIRARAAALPDGAEDAIGWALDRLGIPPQEATEFLQLCLLRINGWAAWCAYLGWEAGLAGGTDPHLRELLAIRAAWEALLHDDLDAAGGCAADWREPWVRRRVAAGPPSADWELIWQRAHEFGYQDGLARLLAGTGPARPAPGATPAAQLVFCIDVRSERLRRALEASDPTLETRGFAGFFGLPIQYRPLGTAAARPQLPGLLSPALEVSDSTGHPDADAAVAGRRRAALDGTSLWRPFLRSPSGGFSLVETLGLGYAGALLRRHFGAAAASTASLGLRADDAKALRPRLLPADRAAAARHADLVAGILRAMGLTQGFARLLVLVGHGSQSANNPQAAALECGACGGHTGEVNARVLAGLLNDPDLRTALGERGIDIPAHTLAVAALHNTTTDEVALLDLAQAPASHADALQRLARGLEAAGQRTRAERAPDLGLAGLVARPPALLRRLRARARDWAETRPEWGLAGNASLIVAPRARTRGLDLAGRAFLHDYDSDGDRDGARLELIMTAPMVVAHWINLQYYASTVDPERFGSGNKVLHNVACGRIGVFEGNTGDLRIGLSRQSVHDGERWLHEPLRLSVVIDAPRARIEAVLRRHATVRRLVEHQWLHLFRFGEDGLEWYRDGRWAVWRSPAPAP
ncbi:MAG: DUF2309 domain-containing protein [Proteobacteria bacterium]|nr:DUF2309 domain-containing protein [Pseudomonadota bacterium]